MGKEEAKIEQYLCDQVKAHGGHAYKLNSVSHRGLPDRMCLFPHGVCVFVECKTSTGKLSKLQEITISKWRAWKHAATVVSSKDGVDALMSDILQVLEMRRHVTRTKQEMSYEQ